MRGEAESGDPEVYFDGLRAAGIENLSGAVIPRCGHFSPDEQAEALARVLREFMPE